MPKTTAKIKKVLTKKKKTAKKKKEAAAKTPKVKNPGYVKIDMSTMQAVEGRGTVYTFRRIP